MWENAQAHPLQTALGAVAGGLIPGGGLIAGQLFNRYNNAQFNNQVVNSGNVTSRQGERAGNAAMDRPLSGALGQFNNSNAPSPGAFNPNSFNMQQQFGQPSASPSDLLSFLPSAPAQTPDGTFFTAPQYTQGYGGGMGGGQNYGNYSGQGGLHSGFGGSLGGSTQGANTVFGGTYGGRGPTLSAWGTLKKGKEANY